MIVEIVAIEKPNEYERESWQLNDDEKISAIKILREEGNKLYRLGKHEDAEKKYRTALHMIEQLLMKYVQISKQTL